MGLSWHALQVLCEAKRRGTEFKKSLTIGRQDCFVSIAQVISSFRERGLTSPFDRADIGETIQYAEPIFSGLGAEQVDSIDNSSYQSATLVWDLNRPIPEEWHEHYDFLYDGGSLEHIFNVPQALTNYMNMVQVGGTVMVDTEANNWMGHGFYQFSPELFYRVFSQSNGFQVDRLVLHEKYAFAPLYEVPDPASIHSRIELSNPWIGVGLMVTARRTHRTELFADWPQQSDYAEKWPETTKVGHGDSQPAASSSHRKPIRNLLKRRVPGLVEWKQKMSHRYPFFAGFLSRRNRIAYHKTHGFTAQPDRFLRGDFHGQLES